MSDAVKCSGCGGQVYLDTEQSKEVAEIAAHTMKKMRQEMDECPFLMQRIECAKVIAELAKSLRAEKPIFWDNAEVLQDGSEKV